MEQNNTMNPIGIEIQQHLNVIGDAEDHFVVLVLCERQPSRDKNQCFAFMLLLFHSSNMQRTENMCLIWEKLLLTYEERFLPQRSQTSRKYQKMLPRKLKLI